RPQETQSIRESCVRHDPSINGPKYLASGPRDHEVIIPVISAPCSPAKVRYWLAPNTCVLGDSSSVRISIAFRPPTRKKNPIPTRYCMPTTLWSVDRLK